MTRSNCSRNGFLTGALSVFVAAAAAATIAGCDNEDEVRVTPDAPVRTIADEPAANQGDANAAQQTKEGDQTRHSLAFPSGEKASSVILLEKIAPQQVRVGQPYQYQIKVTNLTDAALNGVTVSETLGKGFEFDASQPTTRPSDGGGQPEWAIGELGPKESKTIRATVVAREVGKASTCLAVSYQPTLCTPVEVVNPQLTLTKQGPERIHLCDKITYKYVVTNSGTGTAKNVTVEETLPDGLTTADGKTTLALQAGDLPAGGSKDFAVELKAAKTGEYTSHAIAKSATDQAQSSRLTTRVQEPLLDVQANGPEWRYVGQPVSYTVTVTNNGDAVAREAVLKLDGPGLAEDARTRQLGQIEPGQSRTINVTVDGRGKEPVKLVAEAASVCAAAQAATASTAVRTMPALLLETVDNTDPVRIGDNTIYTILVKNQGSAPAKNVTVSAELPAELKYVEGSGQTEVKASGQSITLAPIESLAPGEIATWWVEAKAEKAADTRFRVELKSDYLDQPVPEVEPTRLH